MLQLTLGNSPENVDKYSQRRRLALINPLNHPERGKDELFIGHGLLENVRGEHHWQTERAGTATHVPKDLLKKIPNTRPMFVKKTEVAALITQRPRYFSEEFVAAALSQE